MARTGIDKQQVFNAAAALAEEGTRPTVQTVRERLGSGSFSTISAHLAEWKASTTPASQSPPPIPEGVQNAFARAWTIAAKVAREELAQQREAFEAMRREMEAEQADMAAEIKRLEQTLEEQARRGAQLAAEGDNLKKLADDRGEEITALRIESARFEEQRNAAQKRGDELKAQLDALQADFTAAVKESPREGSKPPASRSKAKPRAGTEPE